MKLFDRDWEAGFAHESGFDAIRGLRMVFTVRKAPGVENPDSIRLRIYNLPRRLRVLLAKPVMSSDAQLVAPFVTLFFKAGYRPAPLIFSGAVWRAYSERVGADYQTDIEGYAYLDALSIATLGKSYADTTAAVILNDLLAQLKATVIRITPKAQAALNAKVYRTYAVSGSAAQAMATILRTLDLFITFNESGILIAADSESTDDATPDGSIPLISPQTGLIGTPRIVQHGVEIRSLLNPAIKVFGQIALQSATIEENTGQRMARYTVITASHTGDTHRDNWYTEAACMYPSWFRKGEDINVLPPVSANQ